MKTIQKERKVIDGIIESLEVSNGAAQSIFEAYEMSHPSIGKILWKALCRRFANKFPLLRKCPQKWGHFFLPSCYSWGM
jgi:hypothetical protein